LIEVRTGNEEIGRRSWRVRITWEQRRAVFLNEAIQVITGRPDANGESKTGIEVDSARLFESLPAEALGVSEEELWATPYAQLQELALKLGLWLWTGIEPDRVAVEDIPLESAFAARPTSSTGPEGDLGETDTISPTR